MVTKCVNWDMYGGLNLFIYYCIIKLKLIFCKLETDWLVIDRFEDHRKANVCVRFIQQDKQFSHKQWSVFLPGFWVKLDVIY